MTDTSTDTAGTPPPSDLVGYRVRRERELSSLYATARSLTALGEVDAVLGSIVREAHELIGTDFTYLSLVGPNGELALKAAQGTISSAFSSARVPPGTGVGGRVIATGAAAWVSNYLQDQDLSHHQSFDDLVGPEGMVALLGVPLLVGDEVIGVLFAADRTERPFEHDEIALLSAFADHAAIAINNARLYDQSRTAVRELQDAYGTIERQVAAMEQAQSVHESLTHTVLTGGGAEEIAQLLVDHLRGSVTVFDRAGAVTAQARYLDIEQPAERPSPDAVEQSRQSGRWATTTDASGWWHSAATIQAGDSHLGALLLTRGHEPTPVDIRTLERAAQITGLLILKETAVAEAEERVRGDLLTEVLLSAPQIDAGQRARAQARGIDLADLDVLIVARSAAKSGTEVSRRLHAIAGESSGLAGEHLGRATLLAKAMNVDQLARTVHSRLRQELGVPVTVIAERVEDQSWGRAFEISSRCIDLMGALGVDDQGATVDEYALFGLLFDSSRADDLTRLVDETIGPLIRYDTRRSTRLTETLTAYFDHAGNLKRTAGALHVHVNTLLKRLDRIESFVGSDWKSPHRSLHLQVACRLHALRTRSPQPTRP